MENKVEVIVDGRAKLVIMAGFFGAWQRASTRMKSEEKVNRQLTSWIGSV